MTKVEELISIVQALPQEAIDDLLKQAQTWSRKYTPETPCMPVKLGGLWRGISITDGDFQAIRAEMWNSLNDK